MIDTYTHCSGYEFYVAAHAAERQMRRAIADDERIQRRFAAQRLKPVEGHDWVTTMDGFASKNYFRCSRCGESVNYAREVRDE